MSRDNNGGGGGGGKHHEVGGHLGIGGSFSSSDLSPSNNSGQVSGDRSRHLQGPIGA